MLVSEVITVTIRRPYAEVYEFLADPMNFTRWASNPGSQIEPLDGGDWLVDLPRGRLYIPLKDCAAGGVDPDDLLAGQDGLATRSLVANEVAWARQLMASGAPLATSLPGHVARRLGWELRLVVQGGLAIADQIEAMDYATVARRPKLRAWHAPLMFWRALRMGGKA